MLAWWLARNIGGAAQPRRSRLKPLPPRRLRRPDMRFCRSGFGRAGVDPAAGEPTPGV
jgi:hypothetical protein